MLCFRTHTCAKGFHRFISDDFMHSYFFLKAKNHFPACEEKCLKQGVWIPLFVMVIRCVRTYNNIKRELPNSEELVDSRFIIVVVARKAGNDHDLLSSLCALQVLFGACKRGK
jgi:hypothetical protein